MFILIFATTFFFCSTNDTYKLNNNSFVLKKCYKSEISYKALTGPLFISQIPKVAEFDALDHEDFEALLEHFKRYCTLKDDNSAVEKAQGQNAMILKAYELYKQNRRDLQLKLIHSPKSSKQDILNGVLNAFCFDVQSLIEAFYKLKSDKIHRGMFFHQLSNGVLKYQLFKTTRLDSSLEDALDTLMLIRSSGRKNYKLGSIFASIRSYGECRLELFEELLRMSIKNGWNRYYLYPINFILSDQIIGLLYGTSVRFLRDSQDVDLNKFEENSELLIRCAKLYKKLFRFAFRAHALHLNNYESTIYTSPVLNTPALYMAYIKSQRSNHWLNKYVRYLFNERAGYIFQDDSENEARLEEILSEVVYRVFDEYGLEDALPHPEYLFES